MHGKKYAGAGDPHAYVLELNKLRKAGVMLTLPKVHIGDATNTPFAGFKQKPFDCLIDAGTFKFVIMQRQAGVEPTQAMTQLFLEYGRIARKVIVIGSNKPGDAGPGLDIGFNEVRKSMQEAGGAAVQLYSVKNQYEISLQAELPHAKAAGEKTILRHQYPYDKAIVARFA